MGKKGLAGLPREVRVALRGLQGNLAQSGRLMQRERAADYRLTQNALDAIFGNLGLAVPDSSKIVARTDAQLAKLLVRARAGKQQVGKTAARLTNAYGSALGGVVTQQLGSARAVAAGTVGGVRGAVQTSAAAGRTAAAVSGIAASGVEAIRASASWAANQALQQRTAIDATTLAQLEAQGWQTVLGYTAQAALQQKQLEAQHEFASEESRLAFERQKELMEFEFNLKTQEAAKQMTPQAQLIVNQGAQYGVELMKAFNAADYGSGNQPSAAEASAAVAQQLGVQDPNQLMLLQTLAQKMYQAGAGPLTAGDVKFNELSGLYQQAVSETLGVLFPDFTPDTTVVNSYLSGFIGNILLYPGNPLAVQLDTGTVGAGGQAIANPYSKYFTPK